MLAARLRTLEDWWSLLVRRVLPLGTPEAALRRRRDRFQQDHPGEVAAVHVPLGLRGARLVLIAQDGSWGELMVRDRDQSEELCSVDGVTLGTWAEAPTPQVSDKDRRRMAGRR